jgi:glycosyltransferase involved in cell wall biosynthesis
MKPVLYGSIAAYFSGCKNIVNAFTGLGFLFVSNKLQARLMRSVLKRLFRLSINGKNSRLILQNTDDVNLITTNKIVAKSKIHLIRGSGVDLQQYFPKKENRGVPIIMLASRMLWDKGIDEYIKAAGYLSSLNIKARFVLVGQTDSENPSGISKQQLNTWVNSGVVEWWGHKENMSEILNQAHVVCLPSYREGLPKVLLEAAACGRPIVTTDAPGCREIVKDGVNGFLVPVRDATAVADALIKLIKSPELRIQMGVKGRELVEKKFSLEKINAETLQVYERLLG